MGMFDYYEPAKTYACPICGTPSKGWQGKDGPCGLFVWQEGEKYPVDQRADEKVRLSVEEMQQWTLPPTFYIYTDCSDHELIYALGTTQNGVWSSTCLQTHKFSTN